ncbi:MAG: hypothetical protein IPI46_10190 [Bacteroidetes bacterium]|nr:hypothetical protein [Bacteroidota bacterium]
MKKLLTLLSFVFTSFLASAQWAPIMVCDASGNNCTQYTNIDAAIVGSTHGDYIYLPGGNFTVTEHVTKKLHFIGTGHYPDSTVATGISVVSGILYLDNGADTSTIDGIFFTEDIAYNTSSSLKYLVVSNCNMRHLNYSSGSLSNSIVRNSVVRQVLQCQNGVNNIITNCFLHSIYHLDNSTISNCIIANSIQQLHNCVIKNNIIRNLAPFSTNSSGNQLISNLTVSVNSTDTGQYLYNNISAVMISNPMHVSSADSLFVNSDTLAFSYDKNYRLKPGSAGSGNGSDSTDRGVYGGVDFPYQDGALPANPHIYYKSINPSTNNNGDLPVNIKVRASN